MGRPGFEELAKSEKNTLLHTSALEKPTDIGSSGVMVAVVGGREESG